MSDCECDGGLTPTYGLLTVAKFRRGVAVGRAADWWCFATLGLSLALRLAGPTS